MSKLCKLRLWHIEFIGTKFTIGNASNRYPRLNLKPLYSLNLVWDKLGVPMILLSHKVMDENIGYYADISAMAAEPATLNGK